MFRNKWFQSDVWFFMTVNVDEFIFNYLFFFNCKLYKNIVVPICPVYLTFPNPQSHLLEFWTWRKCVSPIKKINKKKKTKLSWNSLHREKQNMTRFFLLVAKVLGIDQRHHHNQSHGNKRGNYIGLQASFQETYSHDWKQDHWEHMES